MTDHEDAPDLRAFTQASVPVTWVAGLLIALVSAAVSALVWSFALGSYKSDTDHQLAEQKHQLADLAQVPDRLTRMEMILCSTDEPSRVAACRRLPGPRANSEN